MKYRRLGTTDIELSEIGFGTADNAGLMVKGTAKEQVEAVALAVEAGVNYFETSPSFGRGVAETNLGKAFAELGVRPHVGTMVEILPDGFDDIAAAIGSALDGSLERLGIDGVDVLIVHNPPRAQRDVNEPTWQPVTFDDMTGPALAAFEGAKRAGKAKYFGFATEHCDPDTVKALLDTGAFTLINAWYNVVNPSGGRKLPAGVRFGREYPDYAQIIERAAANSVSVAAFRVLAGGALSDAVIASGAGGRHPNAGGSYSRNPQLFAPEIERSRALAFLKTPSRSVPQAAYAFALAHPGVTTTVAGPSDVGQLRELLAASGMPPLDPAELGRIDAVYAANFGLTEA
jgi:aryl-alcohol dehydrogenase-like predicted oxidoreductase